MGFLAKILLAFLSGVLLILPFSNYNFCFFAWVGFVPLFQAIQNQSKTKSFLLAYFTGVIFWSGTIYWLIHVTLPGMFLLVLYLALYFGIFGFIIKITYDLRLTTYDFFFIPPLWVILEYIRSHLFTGFPWALLGYSQYRNLPVIQISDITGAWGISFLVMMANVVIYMNFPLLSRCYVGVLKKRGLWGDLFFLLCMAAVLSYGYYKIHHLRLTTYDLRLKISVIQGNIPQELKWDSQARDSIVNKYLKLTSEAAKAKPGLIIWPEASLPVVLEEEPEIFERVRHFAKENNTNLLLGVVRFKNNNYYNSAALVSSEGEVLNIYDKMHLVPFGEYIPLKNIFPFLEAIVPIGDFSGGKEYTLFELPWSSAALQSPCFSSLVCFEDVFPRLSRDFTLKGADFLVNITNDAWFKKTSEPYQHLQASVFRAVENRRNVVRCANTGVSAFIIPQGKIISRVGGPGNDIFVDGFDTQEISIPDKKPITFYTRFGDVFVLLCLGSLMLPRRTRMKKIRNPKPEIRNKSEVRF